MNGLERAAVRRLANDVKKQVEDALQSNRSWCHRQKSENCAKTEWLDVTMPAVLPPEAIYMSKPKYYMKS